MTNESPYCLTGKTASPHQKNTAQHSETPTNTKRACVCCGKDISHKRESSRTCGAKYCAGWAVKHTPTRCLCGRPGTILKDGWCCVRCDEIERKNAQHQHEQSLLRQRRKVTNTRDELGWMKFAAEWMKDEMRLMCVPSYRERHKAACL